MKFLDKIDRHAEVCARGSQAEVRDRAYRAARQRIERLVAAQEQR